MVEKPRIRLPKQAGKGDYYWLYFQERAAEEELARDARYTLLRLFHIGFGDTPRDDKMSLYVDRTKGFIGAPRDVPLPPWLSEADLEVFAGEYRRTGFRGGLNWYRNIDRNWELLAPYAGSVITVPALYVAGDRDLVLAFRGMDQLIANLAKFVPQLRKTLILPGCGHWTQQERRDDVNAAMLEFLKGL